MPSINSIVSFFFRCLMASYAIALAIEGINIFPVWVYILTFIGYFTLFFSFRKSGELGAIIRLINDYAFIIIIAYGKGLNVLTIGFIMTPIVNSVNYTGQYGLLASLRLYIATFVALFITNNYNADITWSIPLVVFWVLTNATKGREYIRHMRLVLSNPVGQVAMEQITPYSIHRSRVLKEVLTNFNANRFLKIFHPIIKVAVCFKLKGNNVIVVSASRLVASYELDAVILANDFDTLVKTNFKDFKVKIDEAEKQANLYFCYGNKVGSDKYLYYIEFATAPLGLIMPFVRNMLEHTFGTLSNVFEIEDSIKTRRLHLIKRLKKQAVFLERSTNNIHFINNKLSPVLEYFTIKQSIENGELSSSNDIERIIGELNSKAASNTRMIVSRLAKHLDKKNNPFFSLKSEVLTVEQIVLSLINAWSEHDLSLKFLDIIPDNLPSLYKEIQFQPEGFELVLDEIIENIIKYRFSSYRCSVTIFQHEVVMRFKNDVKPGTGDDLKLLMTQFNSDLVSEMMKRSSHGISMMKNYLLLMNIKSSLLVANNSYVLVLTLSL